MRAGASTTFPETIRPLGQGEIMRKKFVILTLLVCSILAASILVGWRLTQIEENVESWRPSEIRDKVIEFLKTTDVSQFLLENSVEVTETHASDNKLIVDIKYTTSRIGHPDFMLTAVENHVAEITLNANGEVIHAICIHGLVGELIRYWDLIGKRWFP
jgi:hypothetical protein